MISGPKVVRHGKDYKFTISANTLKRSLIASCAFSDTADDKTPFKFEWKQEKIYSDDIRIYNMKVSFNREISKTFVLTKYSNFDDFFEAGNVSTDRQHPRS